jgi:hypothetical protein
VGYEYLAMDTALTWVLIVSIVSIVVSGAALLFLRSAAMRRREDDELDALRWSRERREAMRRAAWLARRHGFRNAAGGNRTSA